ncbi:alpha-1,6-mannosyl-glycoprotein 4-beta-N-acetylglucosaminyltransferase-like [Ylistrum balloti]|uniref:alpha-1,6-mannosyl-glycoprotein 4-beta-N-acetylglucosaminyltransferase-like n=1 Tax=Ylistrum balloti TaxID=509963 RepID=UPI002905D6DB|nr:alpha-1,6-mannosyl-glycoprotein 4-beta-N-acetylglucosaminyltransferase-like [Ylistrum balloti]
MYYRIANREVSYYLPIFSKALESHHIPTSKREPGPRRQPPSPESTENGVTGRLRVDHRKALLYGKARPIKSYLTIGIPTTRRPRVDYLEKTLFSLISHSQESQRMSIVVVIFIVDRNETWTRIRGKRLADKYPELIQNGFLQVVHPHDKKIYPDFKKLKRTFNDSAERVAWRSKQNIDYAYLFSYSENISKYYLHIEDDVLAASSYYTDIAKFIESRTNKFWYYLEFSHIGFIGKLVRSSDLQDLSDYIMLFFAEQPCDLLLLHISKIKLQSRRIYSPKSVFQHIGTVSSLPGKVQKITDKYFKDSFVSNMKQIPRKQFYHVNPSATIETDMRMFSKHKPLFAYDLSDDYFWGISPSQGNYFRVKFKAPQNISHIFIDSGIEGKEADILHEAQLLVSTITPDQSLQPCQSRTIVANFTNGDVDTRGSNISLPVNIDCVIIEITASHSSWIVIREIAIFLPGETTESKKSSLSRKPLKENTVQRKQATTTKYPSEQNMVPGELNHTKISHTDILVKHQNKSLTQMEDTWNITMPLE